MRERTTAFTRRVPLLLLLAASACGIAPLVIASNAVVYALCYGAAICNIAIAVILLRAKPEDASDGPHNNSYFGEIVQNTTDMMGVATLDGKIIYLNAAGRRMLGISPTEDLSECRIGEFHPPWAARIVIEEAIPAALKHGVWQGETMLRPRSGGEIPVSQVVMVQRDAQGKPIYASTVIRDISRLKDAERSGRESLELVQRAEEFSLVMVVRCDPEGRWLHVPTRLCTLLNYSEDELKRMRFQDVTHVDDLERVWSQCQRVARGEIQSFELEKRCLCKNGGEIWTYMNATGVYGGDGKLLYFQAYLRDITEQKKSDAAVKQSEQRFKSVFESPVMGMLLWQDSEIIEANDCFLSMLGYTREDFKSRPLKWTELTPPELLYKDEAAIVELQRTGRVEPFEKEYFHKNGSRIPILICPVVTRSDAMGGVAFVLDISARKRAESELRETAERLTLIAQATNDALWDREIATGKSWWNEAYRTYFGMGEETLPTYENWMSRVHPDDLQRVLATLKAAEQGTGRVTWSAEYRYKLADGTYGHVFDRAIILRNEKGEAYRIAGAMQNMTSRVKAEESIRRLAERLELVSRATNDSIWDRDLRNGEGWWNEVYATRYGLENGRLPSMEHWLSRIHPDDRQRVINTLTEAQGGGATAWSSEYRVKLKDGSYANVLDRALIVRDAEGVPIRVIGSTLDMTDRKQLQEALLENEERYRLLFKNAPESITIVDLTTGKFVEHNAGAEKLFKMTSAELLSVGPAELSPPRQPDGSSSAERARQLCDEAMRGGSPRFEWMHIDKTGKLVPCEIWLTRLPSKDRQLVRGSLVDISGRRLLEEQLRQAQKMEAVGKLAGGIAHDFNNLLVAIIGYGDLIHSQAADGSPQKMGAEQILIAAQRAADLTRQLLAYSRKQILQPKIISLSKTVSDMHRLLERLIGEDIEFVQVLEAAGSVSADPGQIEQVIMNLVLNARDAMPKGGRLTIETVDVELDENYRRQHSEVVAGTYVMLAVSDTGVGMSKDVIDRIFEPFFTTKEVGKGTGLGLSTVYGIVKQSGGHVFVYSEPGAGSTFKIYLPRLKAVNAVESSAPLPAPARGQETILVVEDEEGVRKLVIEVLKRAGYNVISASDGADALRVAGEYKETIDLLVTDVVLPKMGGSAVARELKRLRPTLRVLFMSGYTDNAVVHHGVLDEGIEYLQKPFMPSDFARRVRNLLDKPATE